MTWPQAKGWAREIRFLATAAGLVVAGILGLAGWVIHEGRQAARENALQTAQNLSSALAHDLERTVETYDLALRSIERDVASLPGIWELSPRLRQIVLFDAVDMAPSLETMLVLDEHGEILASSRGVAAPAPNLADAEYFQGALHADGEKLFITRPFQGRIHHQWFIAFSRRLTKPDGSFGGVVAATMRLDYVKHLFERVNAGPNWVTVLARTDLNQIVFLREGSEELVAAPFASGNTLATAGIPPESGHAEAVSARDGRRRLYSYHRVADLPFTVTVALSADEVFRDWRGRTAILAGSVLALIAVAAAFAYRCVVELDRRAQAEREAIENERRYRLITAHVTDMIVVASTDGVLTYVSPGSRHVYGYEPHELEGQAAMLLVHPEDRPQVLNTVSRVLEGAPSVRVTGRAYRKTGELVWFESISQLAQGADGKPEIVTTVRDVTAQKANEAALAWAKAQAESANRAKSVFLANMSHELRTPLNAVIGFSDLMERESFGPLGNERYREYAADIRASGQHLLEMINEILDHAKAEAGHLRLEEEPVDLAGVAAFAIRMLTPRAERSGLGLTAGNLAAVTVLGDERRLRQIALNLLTNAIKFTGTGGRVTLSVESDPSGDAILHIADTGFGIAQDDQDRIFEPFVQGLSGPGSDEGTGLGLPLTKRLVELHGGTLTLDSRLGEGTRVIVRFPASRVVTYPEDETDAGPGAGTERAARV